MCVLCPLRAPGRPARRRWLAAVLTFGMGAAALLLAGLSRPGRPSLAQADPWDEGRIGIGWALWLGEGEYGCKEPLLAALDDPLSPARLLAASTCGAMAIDPRAATVVWRHELQNQAPQLYGETLYFRDTAFDALSGRQLWQVPSTSYGTVLPAAGALYVESFNELWALNSQNGELLWQVAGLGRGTMLLAAGRLVLVGSRETWALDPEDGRTLWHSLADDGAPGNRSSCSPPFALADTLIVNETCGLVRGLDLDTGRPRWQRPGVQQSAHAAGVLYALQDEPGQLVALDARGGELLWVYPETDAAGTLSGPGVAAWGSELLVQGDTIYVVDLDGRVVALDAHSGAARWTSEPVAPPGSGLRGSLRRFGRVLVVGSEDRDAWFVGLDAGDGETLWRLDDLSGYPVATRDGDTLLVYQWPAPQRRDGSAPAVGALHWVQVESGQRLGQLILEPSVEPSLYVQDGDGFAYYVRDGFLYAIGPAAPDRAVEMARTFLGRGDYRSAVRTLIVLKYADEGGYVASGGPSVAAQAMNTWLNEADALLAAQKWDQASTYLSSQALRREMDHLSIRDARAQRTYLQAYLELHSDGGTRTNANHYLRELRREYGDTVWAERADALLVSKRGFSLPRVRMGGPLWLGWWYAPVVLPLLFFCIAAALDRDRENVYRAAVTAGMSCLGGLVYLFWMGRLYLGSGLLAQFLAGASDLPVFTALGFDIALIGGVPLAVWLLTRGKRHALIALLMSGIHLIVLRASLLTTFAS